MAIEKQLDGTKKIRLKFGPRFWLIILCSLGLISTIVGLSKLILNEFSGKDSIDRYGRVLTLMEVRHDIQFNFLYFVLFLVLMSTTLFGRKYLILSGQKLKLQTTMFFVKWTLKSFILNEITGFKILETGYKRGFSPPGDCMLSVVCGEEEYYFAFGMFYEDAKEALTELQSYAIKKGLNWKFDLTDPAIAKENV